MAQLYLIRHAVAEERGSEWPDDNLRPLTEDGIKRMRKAASGLAALGVRFDVVLSSPLVRAKQTAEIVVAALQPKPPMTIIESLSPEGEYGDVMADLRKHARKTRIALVGHEPNIGELAARLIGARGTLEFKKGAICRIDVESLPPTRPGMLKWHLTPAVLRAVK